MSPRLAPVLFGLVLSALMSFIVSGIATLRNAGFVDGFLDLWSHAWIPSWVIAFPTVLIVAPMARRLVGMLVQAPAGDGRQARDVMLRLMKTCRKLAISFFAYLGDRLGLNGTAERIPPLPDLVGAQPA